MPCSAKKRATCKCKDCKHHRHKARKCKTGRCGSKRKREQVRARHREAIINITNATHGGSQQGGNHPPPNYTLYDGLFGAIRNEINGLRREIIRERVPERNPVVNIIPHHEEASGIHSSAAASGSHSIVSEISEPAAPEGFEAVHEPKFVSPSLPPHMNEMRTAQLHHMRTSGTERTEVYGANPGTNLNSVLEDPNDWEARREQAYKDHDHAHRSTTSSFEERLRRRREQHERIMDRAHAALDAYDRSIQRNPLIFVREPHLPGADETATASEVRANLSFSA